MGNKSRIEWTDASWTPVRARYADPGGKERIGWHCEHISEGCRHCYAEAMNIRLGTGRPFKPGELRNGVKLFLDEQMLLQPLRWRKPRRIFVCSMTDLFADFVPDEMIDKIFAVMALCPRHTFQILTKRPARMRAYIGDPGLNGRKVAIDLARQMLGLEAPSNRAKWPLPNVWLGVSGEDQKRADERIPELLATPAAVRFISVEPMLGAVDLTNVPSISGRRVNALDPNDALVPISGPRLDLVIVGGESGPNARPMHPDWARSLRDQCQAARVPFFFKQWGQWAPGDVISQLSPTLSLKHWAALHAGRWAFQGPHPVDVWSIGKKCAGRLLDGRTWDEMPVQE